MDKMKAVFGRVVPEDVMVRILGTTQILGTDEGVSVLLASTLRECNELGPETCNVLNVYFDAVVETVTKHGGIVDKFMGDAVLSLFGHRRRDPKNMPRRRWRRAKRFKSDLRNSMRPRLQACGEDIPESPRGRRW